MSDHKMQPDLTGALEDYLETIYELVRDRKLARVKDIAKARGVKSGSVSPAMRRLSDLGYIKYVEREFIDLTPTGERAARRIYARHQLLKRFFTDEKFAKRREFLRSLSFCKGLSGREVGYLLQSFHARTYSEGEVLFMEDDIGRALFVVESGRLELTKLDRNGKPQRLVVLEPGAFFGEMALLEQMPRSASAVALEKSRVLLLYRSKLDSILHYHPRIGVSITAHLAKLLSARLRRTSQDLSDLRSSG